MNGSLPYESVYFIIRHPHKGSSENSKRYAKLTYGISSKQFNGLL